MLHQILIVDNLDSKVELFTQYCREYLPDIAIFPAFTLKEAFNYIKCPFDLVICDRLLGINNDEIADDFIRQYSKEWPEANIVYYSAEPGKIKNIGPIKCHASEAVRGEIIDYSLRCKPRAPMLAETKVMDQKNYYKVSTNQSKFFNWFGKLGVISAVAVMVSLSTIKLVAQIGSDSINTHIRTIADSTDAHCQIKKELSKIREDLQSLDTTLQYMRALQNQMATQSMKKAAQQEFEEQRYFKRLQ
jgi:hypothetical protein